MMVGSGLSRPAGSESANRDMKMNLTLRVPKLFLSMLKVAINRMYPTQLSMSYRHTALITLVDSLESRR